MNEPIPHHDVLAKSITEGWQSEPEAEFVCDEEQLKVLVNTFVWSNAPASMPLGKADEMAVKIFELMLEARKQFT